MAMKKIFQLLCIFAFLFAVAFPGQKTEAATYFDDAQNYLIWDSGSHHGSAVDLSSAVVIQDTSKYIVIAALDYLVTYERPSDGIERSIEPKGNVYFKEYKDSSDLFCTSDTLNHYRDGKWFKMDKKIQMQGIKAYPIIKARALQNTK